MQRGPISAIRGGFRHHGGSATGAVTSPSLLRPHPATEDRVQRLIELNAQSLQKMRECADKPMTLLVGFGLISMCPRHRFPEF